MTDGRQKVRGVPFLKPSASSGLTHLTRLGSFVICHFSFVISFPGIPLLKLRLLGNKKPT
jgi:hypothetical protein